MRLVWEKELSMLRYDKHQQWIICTELMGTTSINVVFDTMRIRWVIVPLFNLYWQPIIPKNRGTWASDIFCKKYFSPQININILRPWFESLWFSNLQFSLLAHLIISSSWQIGKKLNFFCQILVSSLRKFPEFGEAGFTFLYQTTRT